MGPVRFECCDPIFRVEDMEASLRSYVDLLGFENARWGSDDFTHVSGDQAGAWTWIGVEDVERSTRDTKLAE